MRVLLIAAVRTLSGGNDGRGGASRIFLEVATSHIPRVSLGLALSLALSSYRQMARYLGGWRSFRSRFL